MRPGGAALRHDSLGGGTLRAAAVATRAAGRDRGLPHIQSGANLQGFVDRIGAVRARMAAAADRAGRDPAAISLLGASKRVGGEGIRLAVEAGLAHFGENRVQEARGKIESLGDLEPPPTWHMIGHLQSNKVPVAVRLFDWIHSVDSVSLAQSLDRAAGDAGRQLAALLEVNTTGEGRKFGVAPERVLETLATLLDCRNLEFRGLMTMGRMSTEAEDARAAFGRLRELLVEARREFPDAALDQLSMGMSGDFEVAIEEGATHVRLGTALFGPRPR